MSDKITTLHLKNDPSTNVYPNVKMENIPLDVTITRDGENLAKTKTIYEFTTSKFLSLDGGTMDGIITINAIGIPEKTILGDGVEVVEESNPAEPVTHYGCGYILQDDDEDSSIKYEYHFPKKSGTFALEGDLNLELSTNDFLSYFEDKQSQGSNFLDMHQKSKIPNGLYKIESTSIHKDVLSLYFNQFYIISVSTLLNDGNYISSIENFYTDKTCYIDLNTNIDTQYIFIVFGNIIYVDCFRVI